MPATNSASPRLFGRVRFRLLWHRLAVSLGAAMPLLVSAITPTVGLIPLVSGTSLVFLALLGGVAARAGGAGVTVGAIRVTFWGALAMALTAESGRCSEQSPERVPTVDHAGRSSRTMAPLPHGVM